MDIGGCCVVGLFTDAVIVGFVELVGGSIVESLVVVAFGVPVVALLVEIVEVGIVGDSVCEGLAAVDVGVVKLVTVGGCAVELVNVCGCVVDIPTSPRQ